MAATEDARCPSCGREVPAETAQHALALESRLVECPHCGARVTLHPEVEQRAQAGAAPAEAAPPGREEGRETFAGEETVEGVMDELSDKEGGPR